jgi:hypothetical protein
VQAILGHKHVDTTLRYARVYDATVSWDYYQAMEEVERWMEPGKDSLGGPPTRGQLPAGVDVVCDGPSGGARRGAAEEHRAHIMRWPPAGVAVALQLSDDD